MKTLFLIGVFCLFSLPATVSACSCYTDPPPIAFNTARLVFIGRMLGGTEEISRTDGAGNPTQDGMVVYSYRYARTDSQGRFRVEGFTGESYIVQASVRKGRTREELVMTYSLPQEISTGGNVEGLKLTLSEQGQRSKVNCSQ